MDLTDLTTIKKILRQNNLRPKKGYGQNFLLSPKIIAKIAESAELSENDTVIEVGSGLGTLTQELAKHAGLVLAIESDYKIVEWLRKYFKNSKNVKIIHGDILQFKIEDLRFKNEKTNHKLTYKVVSNLPYNITSPIIRKFLEAENKPSLIVLMVQREVAERLTAKSGSADRGILTVMVELFGGAEIVEIVPRTSFWPMPEVDSAIIKLKTQNSKLKTTTQNLKLDTKAFMKFVKIGFSQKRRQIHHPLSAGLHLPKDKILAILKSAGIEPTMRAEDLNLEEWIKLHNIIKFKF